MKDGGRTVIIISLSAFALLLICGASFAAYQLFFNQPEPTPSAGMLYTQAAKTFVAQMTLDAGANAVVQLTQNAQSTNAASGLPSNTPAPTFATVTQAAPTFVAPPTATPWWVYPTSTSNIVYPPTATQPPVVPCNRATFITDVTIPDGTVLPANTNFTKIWRVRNDGACFWDSSYALIFTTGTPMTSNTTVLVPVTVAPGQTVDLGVGMRSPGSPGTYQSNWMFRSPRGEIFGVGSSGTNTLFARIKVQASPNPDPQYAYDFAANYCNAQWRSEVGTIGCTTPATDSRGSVVYTTSPDLETRNENEPGLWVRPNQAANGYILGQYPPYQVKAGDRFVTEISCQEGSTNCDITFRVDYILPNGTAGNLGAWREVYDDRTNVVDISLSGLVGQSVQFVLRMQNNGKVSQANGIWFLPSIRNTPPTKTPLPPTVTATATQTPTVTPTLTPTNTQPPYPYPYPYPGP